MVRIKGLDDEDRDPLADDEPKGASDEFARLLDESFSRGFTQLATGDRVTARVISIGQESVFVDVGQRSEGLVEKLEFTPEELAALRPGDTLQLYVASTAGGIELTKALKVQKLDLDGMREAMNSGLPIEGKVVAENKGGYTVELPGGKGFVPFSQIDYGPRKSADAYIGQTLRFRVTRVSGRDVVLSRAELLREELEQERQKLLANLEVGQIREGKIAGIETFGVFVDLGSGLTGLVPMGELSWSRVGNLKDQMSQGQAVQVKILKIETGGPRPRLLLSTKQAGENPWGTLGDRFNVGEVVRGTVTRLMPFGAFVEIAPGIEGLIHISEMSAKKRIVQPGEVVSLGGDVTARITAIDTEAKRLSLSIKALEGESLDSETRAKHVKQAQDDAQHRGVELVSKGSVGTLGDFFLKAQKASDRKKR